MVLPQCRGSRHARPIRKAGEITAGDHEVPLRVRGAREADLASGPSLSAKAGALAGGPGLSGSGALAPSAGREAGPRATLGEGVSGPCAQAGAERGGRACWSWAAWGEGGRGVGPARGLGWLGCWV